MTAARVVASGSIRVDVRRAVAKLREHLLVDLHAYALELVRATAAAGGERLHVSYDSDDLVFSLPDIEISDARLPQLLAYVLSDTDEIANQPLRLLALGVNAALGLGPSFVDVFRCVDGEVSKVRWTPALLARDEAPLPKVERAKRPARAPKRGVVVHVRRKLGKSVLVNAITGRVPREIQLLSAHTHESPTKLELDGRALRREGRAHALLRVSFRLPNATRADVEILPVGVTPSIEIHERGVRLTELAWSPMPGLPATSADGVLHVPARVVVDSPMLETNASRSSLREDSDMMRALLPAANEAFRTALDALVRLVTGDGKLSRGVKQLDMDPLRLEDALGAIVCVVANAPPSALALRELASLLQLPLLHLADGTRTSVAAVRGERVLHVLEVKQPLSPRLRPWFSQVVALRGRSIEHALSGISLVNAAGMLETAARGAERREAHLSRPSSRASLPAIHNELARETFCYRDGRWAGLEGEVALVVPRRPEERISRFRFYVEERLLEALPLQPAYVPLAFEAALSWPGRVRPRFGYDAIERDGGMVQAIHAATQIAIGLANKVAVRMKKLNEQEREALAPILRLAIVSFGAVPERMGLARPHGFSRRFRALYAAPLFATTTGERVSLADLGRQAADDRAIMTVHALHGSWSRVDGRRILVAHPDDARMIGTAIGAHVNVVPYARAFDQVRSSEAERRERLLETLQRTRVSQGLAANGPVWSFRIGSALGAMTPSNLPTRIDIHAGVQILERASTGTALPLITVVDDPELVPTPSWDGALTATRDTAADEKQLVQRLVRALGGDLAARAELGESWDELDPAIVLFLLELSARDQKAIEAVPFLTMLDAAGAPRRVSLAEVIGTHGTKFPILEKPPGFATTDWHPVLAPPGPIQAALQRRFPHSFVATFLDITQRENKANAARAKRELLEGSPELDATDLGDLAEPGARRVEIADLVTGISVVAALPRPGPTPVEGRTRVLFLSRKIAAGVDAPFAAVLNLSREEDLDRFRFLSTDGAARVQAILVDAGSRLLETVLDAACTPGNSGLFFGDARALDLYAWLVARDAALPLEAKMFDTLFWPTVQGDEQLSHEFWRLNETWYGTVRYLDWARRDGVTADLDRPVAWLPPGPHQGVLLEAFRRRTLRMRDVTTEAANLQKERGTPQAPPILTGMPLHPALRVSLARLGVTLGVGELELVPGPGSQLHLQLLGAQSSVTAPELGIPVRVVVRVESMDAAGAATAVVPVLQRAIEKLLVELLPLLDTLPPFVRENAKKLALSRLGGTHGPLLSAPLFVDTTGLSASASEIVSRDHEPWAFTTLLPPFPTLKRRCLLMSKDEAKLAKPYAELRLADPAILRAREIVSRRNAPQLAYIGLTESERTQCVVTSRIQTQNVTGEVGVLTPHAQATRGIRVNVTRRLLCTLDDAPGLPLIASINDDTIKPDRSFSRIAHVKRAVRVASEVREHARRALEQAFAAPSDCLGSEWMDDQPCGGLRVTGRVWIPADPARIGPVRLTSPLAAQPSTSPLCVAAPRGIHPELPVEARLVAVLDGAASLGAPDAIGQAIDRALNAVTQHAALKVGVGELVLTVAAGIVTSARAKGANTPVLDEYAVHLALLGAKISCPTLETTENLKVSLEDVRVELQRRGAVWTSDGAGFVEGQFPSVPPAFILREGDSPAFAALRARVIPSFLLRVGASAVVERHPEIAVEKEQPAEELPLDTTEPGARFWKSLGERVSSLFQKESEEQAHAPILDQLFDRVSRLQLAGDPVKSVVDSAKGRPLRYDRKKQRLHVCTRHPIVVQLSRNHTGISLLAAAAATEINRALSEVTDGDERRALLTLLQ